MRSIRAIESALVAGGDGRSSRAVGGCRGPLEAPLAAAHPSDETPRRGGTLHLATIAGDITTLDPAASSDTFSASVDRLVYAGLVDFDAAGLVVPDIAGNVEEADGGRTYRFTLRDGARFHDGSELTAADVKRSIERALHPSTPSAVASRFGGIAGFSDFTEKKAPHLSGVVVEGRYVVAIHLREPDATFLPVLLALLTYAPRDVPERRRPLLAGVDTVRSRPLQASARGMGARANAYARPKRELLPPWTSVPRRGDVGARLHPDRRGIQVRARRSRSHRGPEPARHRSLPERPALAAAGSLRPSVARSSRRGHEHRDASLRQRRGAARRRRGDRSRSHRPPPRLEPRAGDETGSPPAGLRPPFDRADP